MDYDLAGVTEVGDLLGVSRQRAAQLAETPGFPSPVADLASGRIWRVQDLRLWAETRRRGGRPRSGFRIEYVGDRDDRRNGRHTVSLRLVTSDEPRLERAMHRSIDRGLVAFASQQLATERPPAQALLTVRRALANLCGLQLRRQTDDADFLIERVPLEAQLDHRWSRHLLSHSESLRHPIPDLRSGEVLHLMGDQTKAGPPEAARSGHIQLDCGHWTERALVPGRVVAFETQVTCPTCGKARTLVGIWPKR
jgi:prophage regulatory protein